MASMRLKAVAVGTARAASMYLVGNPGAAHYVRPLRPFYDPSDPASGHNTALAGVPIGALPGDGDICLLPVS